MRGASPWVAYLIFPSDPATQESDPTTPSNWSTLQPLLHFEKESSSKSRASGEPDSDSLAAFSFELHVVEPTPDSAKTMLESSAIIVVLAGYRLSAPQLVSAGLV